jgi:hypothetical protein
MATYNHKKKTSMHTNIQRLKKKNKMVLAYSNTLKLISLCSCRWLIICS